MKRVFLIVFVFISNLSFGQKSFVPASPYPITVTQPDGTSLLLYGKGDERTHYSATDDGYTVVRNQRGGYEYAALDSSDDLIPTGISAKNKNSRPILENAFVAGLKKNIKPRLISEEVDLKSATAATDFPNQGQNRTLLLLIKYPDLNSTYSTSQFDNLMDQPNYGGTGSFRDYYLANSNNSLDVNIDVFGWYTAQHDYEYYGDDNGDNVARELVREAVNAAEAAGVDFSVYDNDGNGYVDNLMVVHSGPGAEEGSQTQYIWSHSWSLGGYSVVYDGVRINDYIIQPETRTSWGGMVGIGVFCHEFGHALGLPDLYDTDDSSEGLGRWCLMASGSWLNQERTPAMMSAWCRERLGWVSPTVINWPVSSSSYGNYSLQPSATSTQVYKIKTQDSDEYFLLENKYKTGFNAYLPGSGLAIFHIDNSKFDNGDNDDESHKLADLEEADGDNDLDLANNRGDSGDLFPGSSSNTVFDDYSYPGSKTYAGANTGINIRSINLNGSVVNFSLNLAQTPGPNLTFNPSENYLSLAGTVVDINLQVQNTGNEPSGVFSVGYYLSTTLPVTSSGYLMGSDNISNLASGAGVNIGNSADITTIPSLPPGNYYAGYVIDFTNSVEETSEFDNSFSFDSPQVTQLSKPNLMFVPESNSLSINNNTVSIGLEVKNDGNSAAAASFVGYYLSADQEITTGDYLMSNDFAGILNPSQTSAENMVADIPSVLPQLPSGHYYAGFIVDYLQQVSEEDEADNSWCFSDQLIEYCEENRTAFSESICEGESAVFNGVSYSVGGEYIFGYAGFNGCDSIVVFNLTVHQHSFTELNETICLGESFQVGQNFYSAAGTYNVSLENINGCDSLVALTLQIRQPQVKNLYRYICQGDSVKVGSNTYRETGVFETVLADRFGCDSTIIMHLTVNPVNDTILNKTICEGEFVTVGSYSYNTPGTYIHTLTNRLGCDSIVTLNLTVNTRKEIYISETICEGDSVVVGGIAYKSAGVFETILSSYSGCDSVVTLTLAVNPHNEVYLSETVCQGQSVNVAGTDYSTTGIYVHNLENRFGCDSVVTLNLTVVPAADTTIHKEICEGDSIIVGNSVYKQSGIYEKTITGVGGCSYIVTLFLEVHPTAETYLDLEICPGDSVPLGARVYSTTGDYAHVFETLFGCDSVVYLHLKVNPADITLIADTICSGDSAKLGNDFYKGSGIYTHHFINRFGCDSVVTLNLKVRPADLTLLTETVCVGDSSRLGNDFYKESGVYTHHFVNRFGCDSVVALELKVNPDNDTALFARICEGSFYTVGGSHFNETGIYFIGLENRFGCDSTVMLDLEVIQHSDTTIFAEICSGGSFSTGNSDFSDTGIFTEVIENSQGCDSVITLHLTVLPTDITNLEYSACHGDSLLVGASVYKTSGSYSDTLSNRFGCDSIVNLHLIVLPVYNTLLSETICEGDSVEAGGINYKTTGIYESVFVSQFGCDSLVRLDLVVNPVSDTAINIGLCQGESYLMGGTRYSKTGKYSATLENRFGCDSVVTLAIKVYPVYYSTVVKSICEGDSLVTGSSVYKTSGEFRDTLVSSAGCDSIVTTRLTVNSPSETVLNETICEGGNYFFGTVNRHTSGTYYQMLTNQFGCDSLVTLNLQVNPADHVGLTAQICQGDSFNFGGADYSQSGQYVKTYTNRYGCDSVVTLNLTVNPASETEFDVSLCKGESYILGGDEFSETGVFHAVFVNQSGCDSVVTLNLAINQPSETNLSLAICEGDSVVVGSSVYRQSGIFSSSFVNYHGCDSLVVLGLTVKPRSSTELFESICSGESVYFNGLYYTAPGIYNFTTDNSLGCDSVATLHLAVNLPSDTTLFMEIMEGDSVVIGESVYKTQGIFSEILANYSGCDSTVALVLTVKERLPDDVADKHSSGPGFKVYPNPSDGEVTVEIFNVEKDYRLKLISADGKTLLEKEGSGVNGFKIETLELMGLSKGIYSVVLESGGLLTAKRIILN